VRAVELRDAGAFLDRAGPLLLADEPRHNLALGIAGTLRGSPGYYPGAALWLVLDGDAVVGAALRTPPHNLIVARPTVVTALSSLADTIGGDLPGVTGALPEAEGFADAWVAARGGTWTLAMAQRIHALTSVQEVTEAAGHMRPANDDDRALAISWWHAFAVEAGREGLVDEAEATRAVEHRLATPGTGIALWEHRGKIVSLAGYGGPTPTGIRVGPVYTPPRRRGHGYATSLVAALSRELLVSGRRSCFLYTDAANPTANRIYARIGYEHVCDSAEIAFSR